MLNSTNKKRIEAEKNVDRDGKALYKLMNKTIYGKTIENLKNRTDIKLVSNKKHYLKWTPELSYRSNKIFKKSIVI